MTEQFQSNYTLPEGSHRGTFNVRGGDNPLWDLSYEFRDVNPGGPVCIIVPGHRSRGIDSPGNAAVTRNIAEKVGMSVLAFDYTGCENQVKRVDPVTMDSNITDTKAVVGLFGQRPHVMLARSYGFGVALSSASERTQGLIGALPVPDLFEAMYKPHFEKKPFFYRWGFEAIMGMRGYFCWQPKKKDYTKVDFVKITQPFVKSLKGHKLSDIFERQQQRPPVHLIANDGDKVASVEKTARLSDELRQAGFSVKFDITNGSNHELSGDSHRAVVKAARQFLEPIQGEEPQNAHPLRG